MSDQQIRNQRSSVPLVLGCAIVMAFVFWLGWKTRHEQIAQRLLIWKGYEIYVWAMLLDYAKERQGELFTYFRYARVVELKEIFRVGTIVGYFWCFIPVSLAAWWARDAMKNPTLKAKSVYTIQRLLEVQSQNFSAVAPILQRDLGEENPPEWASSVHPEEWVAQHGLVVGGELDVGRARDLLIAQLGKPLEKFSQLSPAQRALFAIFGLRAFFKDADAARKLIDSLNYSASNPSSKPDFSLADAAFKRCIASPQSKTWLQKHRYTRTLLMGLLIAARESGILASAEFIWLKPHDRALWYPLNTAGRKAPFMESAGVFNHMQAEEVAWENGCVLVEPHVEDAIKGLVKYLDDTGVIAAPTDNHEFSLLRRQ